MRFDILSLFPDMFSSVFGTSIIKRACEKGLVEIKLTDIRQYSQGRYRKVDDKPFGGGPGMVMMCGPVFEAVETLAAEGPKVDEIILLTPQGAKFNQELALELSQKQRLLLIAGHYEGFDERIRSHLATKEISTGDYVLSGGELPAMTIVDATTRLIPGVLGDDKSSLEETFSDNLLEYPQYTRPAEFRGLATPEVLLSGNHAEIEKWRCRQRQLRTRDKRPDLADKHSDQK